MRLFVYEYACAQPASVALPASVRREGRAMFEAVLEDGRKLEPAIEVITQHSGLSTQDYALIIAPEFDGILERIVREVAATGCRLLGPLPGAIALTADKWALFQHWKKWGVPTPITEVRSQEPVASITQNSLLKKHRYGAGSLGVSWWKPGDPLEENEIIQEYVPGVPVSVALLISSTGRVSPLLPAVQEMGEDFSYLGGSFISECELQERVTKLALQAVQHIPGLQGYVGVDAILGPAEDGSGDRVLEINPRLTTSYLGLRQACQVNLVQCMLDAVMGKAVVPISWDQADIRWTADGCQ